MLVLTRRLGETLMIGDDIQVTILGVSGAQVRVGITAPKDVAVDRAEIRERKDAGQPAPLLDENAKTPIENPHRRTIIRSRLYGGVPKN